MLSFFPKAWDFVRHPTNSRTMAIIIMLVLVSAVSLTVIVAQQQQSTKQRASGIECKLDTASCEIEQQQCEQQCEALKQNTTKFYTCTIHSYNDQNCQEQIKAIGSGICGEQDISSGCNDLGEENGSSKTVCLEDSTCVTSNNDNCITSCGQQRSVCDNNITVNYSNCVRVAQQSAAPSPTDIPSAVPITLTPTPIPTLTYTAECTQDNDCSPGYICNQTTQTCVISAIPVASTALPENQVPPADTQTLPIVTPQPSDQVSPTILPCPLKSKGDANCDEKIDVLDFNIWRGEFMKALNTTSSDFNSDGLINTQDFNIWRDNFLQQP